MHHLNRIYRAHIHLHTYITILFPFKNKKTDKFISKLSQFMFDLIYCVQYIYDTLYQMGYDRHSPTKAQNVHCYIPRIATTTHCIFNATSKPETATTLLSILKHKVCVWVICVVTLFPSINSVTLSINRKSV